MEAFFQLKAYLETLGERRKMVFIDELPWFDTPRSNFISALELFWNQWASDQNIMLIVCGSATSWMVNKLLGGTPYYLNMLRPDQSLTMNINRLFFEENGELSKKAGLALANPAHLCIGIKCLYFLTGEE